MRTWLINWLIDWWMDGWMDGWVGWTINTSHIPVYIQWYALLVCPSLSFLGQYLENTEYCKVCVSWHWMPTLVLLGVLRGHKNWNYAVNERQIYQCFHWIHLHYHRAKFACAFNNEIQTLYNLYIYNIILYLNTVGWPLSYVILTRIL